MSVPFYYQGGNLMSATLKRDFHRVRTARPERYKTRKAAEKRIATTLARWGDHRDQDGREYEVTVTVPAKAEPMPARMRHEMFVLGREFFRD